jgi:glutathione S-transferase
MAIIEYLNEVHPYPHHLFPGDAIKRAQIRAFC